MKQNQNHSTLKINSKENPAKTALKDDIQCNVHEVN